MHALFRISALHVPAAAVLGASFLAGSPPALAGSATLQAAGGGAWTGTPNSCSYTAIDVDSGGNVTVTCQGTPSGPTPPVVLNAPNQSLVQGAAMNSLNLAGYVQTTDGDPITGYSYTGSLPAGISLNAATGQVSGTPTAAGTYTINWTASDKDGAGTADSLQFVVGASGGGSTGTCGPTPSNYTVQDYPSYDSSSFTYVTTIPAGQGLALRFTVNNATYPYGYKLTDAVGGTKTYTISRCPGGTDGPVDGQNGTTSVNGDGRLDNCGVLSAYVRYKETSGASPVFYTSGNLSWQTTCFLPTTTALGSGTPATYYLNIFNGGTSQTSIQFKNNAQIN